MLESCYPLIDTNRDRFRIIRSDIDMLADRCVERHICIEIVTH